MKVLKHANYPAKRPQPPLCPRRKNRKHCHQQSDHGPEILARPESSRKTFQHQEFFRSIHSGCRRRTGRQVQKRDRGSSVVFLRPSEPVLHAAPHFPCAHFASTGNSLDTTSRASPLARSQSGHLRTTNSGSSASGIEWLLILPAWRATDRRDGLARPP